MNSDYHIITTGGTIDSLGIDSSKEYIFGKSNIPEIIQQWWMNILINWTHFPPIDSLNMEDSYRDTIVDTCKNSSQDRILITHCTDTLVETAQYLEERIIGRIIVLVGSMVPASKSNTDAHINLGYAFGVLQNIQQSWVYIAMNGQVFFPTNVKKNKERWRFELIK